MPSVDEVKIKKTEKMKLYMRQYNKKKNEIDSELCKAYSRSIKMKRKYKISQEEYDLYGAYYSDVSHLKKIINLLPTELFNRIVTETQV